MVRRVVITRPAGPYAGGRKLAQQLSDRGYQVLELPLLRCTPIALSVDNQRLIEAKLANPNGAWLAFLSPTAVWVWSDLVGRDTPLAEATAQAKIAAQGSGTADAVRECFGRAPDFIPTVFVAEEFAREFAGRLRSDQSVIVPQSADGRDLFAPTLGSLGFQAHGIETYQLKPEHITTEALATYRSFVDAETVVIFMSPSAVRAAVGVFGASLGTDKVVSVGPITSQALKSAGLPVWQEAREHSETGVVAVLQGPTR